MMRRNQLLFGFIALALLLGPIAGYAQPSLETAMRWQTIAAGAVISFAAGAALLLVAIVRRERMLNLAQWLIVVLLLLPQWLAFELAAPLIRSIPGIHEIRWGVTLLIQIAAPLWLGLLSALGLVETEIPRGAIAAGIVALGAVCFVVPLDAMVVAPNQLLVLLLRILLGIALVYAWCRAHERIAGASIFAWAGSYLLLRAAGGIVFSVLHEGPYWQPVAWREVMLPLLFLAVVAAAAFMLWFWLLGRMSLGAFSMHPLAIWAASILPGFVMFGFLRWRIDAALLVAVGAIVVGMRSRAEEQAMSQGLRVR